MRGILLAAGYGRRFDPAGEHDKLLAPLADGRPLLWHSATRLCRALPGSLAVVRPDCPRLAALLREAGCEVLESAAAEAGMGSALAHAVRATPGAGWVVALGDMPWVPPAVIAAVAAAVTAPGDVAAPRCRGRRGHPVAFGAAWEARLAGLEGDAGARAMLAEATIQWVDTADEGVLRDVDRPADLAPSPPNPD